MLPVRKSQSIFAGYEIINLIGEGTSGHVYRAKKDNKEFALKILSTETKNGVQTFDPLRFSRESTLAARFNHENLLKIYDFGLFENIPYVCMELIEGGTLTDLMKSKVLSSDEILKMALELASALNVVHRFRIIHRDIKPDNILVTAHQQMKLIDFGLAGETEDSDLAIAKQENVGTFDYSAPEQIGFSQNAVDERSDLFSLGVVLYQAATQKLPYQASSLTELFEAFKANRVQPLREINPNLSPALSMIIEKMIQLRPAKRYQTAQGLVDDLLQVSDFDVALGKGESVTLGFKDGIFARKIELAGREAETALLKKMLQSSLSGRCCGALIEGEPGVGKSRLSREVIIEAKALKKIVLEVKCSFQEKRTDYAALRKIFDSLLSQMRHESEDSKIVFTSFSEAAKGLEQVVLKINPEFHEFFSETSKQDQEFDFDSFAHGLGSFFSRLSKNLSGLVLFVDDLQWVDDISAKLLKVIFDSARENPLFFLSTGRSDPQSKADIDLLWQTLVFPSVIRELIQPLSPEAIVKIIKNFLGNYSLQENLQKKLISFSNGNPLLLIENLNRLAGSGYLILEDSCWRVKDENFSNLGLSDNIFELILSRFKSLPAETFSLLQKHALYGSLVTAKALAALTDIDTEKLAATLDQCVKTDILERPDEGLYVFPHDRVKEAVLSTIPDQVKSEIYTHFARKAYEKLDLQNSSQISDLIRFVLNTDMKADPAFSAKCLVIAARDSNKNMAFSQTCFFLETGFELISSDRVENSIKTAYLREFAAASTELGKTDFAVSLLERIVELTDSEVEIATAKYLKMMAETHAGYSVKAWRTGLEFLSDHGLQSPSAKPLKVFEILGLLSSFFLSGFKFARSTENEFKNKDSNLDVIICRALDRTIINGVFLGQPKPVIARLVLLLHKHATRVGPSVELLKSKGMMINLFSSIGIRRLVEKEISRNLTVAKLLKTKSAWGNVEVYRALGMEALGDVVKGESLLAQSITDYGWNLMAGEYGNAWIWLCSNTSARGHSQKTLDYLSRFTPRTEAIKRTGPRLINRFLQKTQHLVLGNKQEVERLSQEIEQLIPQIEDEFMMVRAQYVGLKVYSAYESVGLDQKTDFVIDELFKFRYDNNVSAIYYIVCGLYRLRQIQTATVPEQRIGYIQKFQSELKWIKKNIRYAAVRPMVMALDIADLRIQGKTKEALKKMAAAEAVAERIDSQFAKYILLQEKARICRDLGQTNESIELAKAAYGFAEQNRWVNRMELTKREFKLEGLSKENEALNDSKVYDKQLVDTLLKISLTASLEMNPQRQVKNSLDAIIKVMNAERAYVFLRDEKTGTLEFSGGRDNNQNEMTAPVGYSSTVVKKVFEEKTPLVLIGNDQMEALGSKSAVIHGLRSILAAPLLLNGEIRGVLYVDSSIGKCRFSNKDLDILNAIAGQIAISFEILRLHGEEVRKKEIEKDLEITAKVQDLIMPKLRALDTDRFSLSGFSRAAVQCGGDWWWHHHTDEKSYFFIGDVTGHGVGPAMLTSYMAACFDVFNHHSDLLQFDKVLVELNQMIHNMAKGEFVVSAVAIEMNYEKNTLQVWNCASPGVVVFQTNQEAQICAELSSFLGGENFAYAKSEFEFQKGDRFFVTTDGFLETPVTKGSTFGHRRLLKLLNSTQNFSVQNGIATLTNELDKILNGEPQLDDVTMVYFEYKK